MLISFRSLLAGAAGLGLLASAAYAGPSGNGSAPRASAVQGTVVVMRGNSVTRVTGNEAFRQGDRVLSRSGGSLSFSNGTRLGPNQSMVSGGGSWSASGYSGKGKAQKAGYECSGLFGGCNPDDGDWHRNDRGKGHDKGRGKGHGDHPGHGRPPHAPPCSY